jgi:ribosome-binding factor A
MSERMIKVNDLLRDLVAGAFISELSLKPGVFLTIAKVTTSRDLRYATIAVSVFPEGEEQYVRTALKNDRRILEKAVHGKLYMKPMPRLRFAIDGTEQKADEVEKLLLREDF